MGFYQPAQLVRDAREHGVEARPVDVNQSEWDCTLEANREGKATLRLGLRLVHGLSRKGAERLVAARHDQPFRNLDDMAHRAGLDRGDLKALAAADALLGLSGHRHQASWEVAGIEPELPLLAETNIPERQPKLSPPEPGRAVLADYAHTGLSLRSHPLALLRSDLRRHRFLSAREISQHPDGRRVRAAGLVLIRQRPGNGNAVFITLEDETGSLNLVVWRDLAERQRRTLLSAKLLGVSAKIQRAGGVQHLICHKLEDHTNLLGGLRVMSRDFH